MLEGIEWGTYIKDIIGLLAIVDPLGAIPIFLSSTKDLSPKEQISTIRVAVITATCTLILFAWAGESLLGFFGISIESFRVAGGILLLFMGLSMLYAQTPVPKHGPDEAQDAAEREGMGAVPLGVPLLAGPGGIMLCIVTAHRVPGVTHIFLTLLVVIFVMFLAWGSLRLAQAFSKKIGKSEINIATRLMGLIIMALAVEFVVTGLQALFPGLVGGL
jgi:MarC family membrane protein